LPAGQPVGREINKTGSAPWSHLVPPAEFTPNNATLCDSPIL
jgi:hypothetical protein